VRHRHRGEVCGETLLSVLQKQPRGRFGRGGRGFVVKREDAAHAEVNVHDDWVCFLGPAAKKVEKLLAYGLDPHQGFPVDRGSPFHKAVVWGHCTEAQTEQF